MCLLLFLHFKIMPVMHWNMQILLIGCNKRFADRLYHSWYCVWRGWQAFFTQRQGWQTDQETFHVPLVVQVRVLFISAHKCTCTCAVDSRQWPGWKYIALISDIIMVKSLKCLIMHLFCCYMHTATTSW